MCFLLFMLKVLQIKKKKHGNEFLQLFMNM